MKTPPEPGGRGEPFRVDELARRLEAGRLLTAEAELLSYSYDGALDRARPDA
ncbi:MAG: hypothetical protein HY553_15885, partial [Elusimicrobia bacterium]|nr:hypothetical protein [Elusimicrobiota bacterium]